MRLSDFDFDLPEALVATRPAHPRSSARLLLADGDSTRDMQVLDLPNILRKGDLLVLNNTRVIPGRLFGTRNRGETAVAKIEITLLEPQPNGTWRALAKPLRKLKEGETVTFGQGLEALVARRGDVDLDLIFNAAGPALDQALHAVGHMPLPPYIAAKRPADAQDSHDYQTVFARHFGAVAAPTASLHFDDDLLDRLGKMGVEFAEVTLHVGAGTFLPVKVEDVTTHRMHAEWGEVTPAAAETINAALNQGRRVIPVGTTALRLIETAGRSGRVQPWTGPTDIFIYPGFDFRIVSGLMTNFHLPKSTLLLLVSALMGKARIEAIYAHAIHHGYRFFSYGDSSLLLPSGPPKP